MSDELKCKVSLKGLNTVSDVYGMIMTLNKQYGLWTDKDYKAIGEELVEASNNGYEEFISVFEKYYGEYVKFIDVSR